MQTRDFCHYCVGVYDWTHNDEYSRELFCMKCHLDIVKAFTFPSISLNHMRPKSHIPLQNITHPPLKIIPLWNTRVWKTCFNPSVYSVHQLCDDPFALFPYKDVETVFRITPSTSASLTGYSIVCSIWA